MWRVVELVLGTFKHGKDLDGILALKVVCSRPEPVLARTKPTVSSPTPLISQPTY